MVAAGTTATHLRGWRKAFRGFVAAGLVEDEFGGAAGAVGDESDLGVDDFEEEIARAFGKYREGGLTADLYGQMIAVTSNGHIDARSELIDADVSIE